MAVPKTTLEYINTSGNWVQATTPNGNDAVIMVTVEQHISAPSSADIILANRSERPAAGSPGNAKGNLTNVFTDFQKIRLVNQETGIVIFAGRIHRLRKRYDLQYGNTIRIYAFDALKELEQFPVDDPPDSLKKINTRSASTDGYNLRKKSQLIKYILDKLGLLTNVAVSDTDHFDDSWEALATGDTDLNISKMSRRVMHIIRDLALIDPIKNSSGTDVGESGHDFRVDPYFTSSAANHKPVAMLNYFARGTRPGRGGAYNNEASPTVTNTANDSLTIEYPHENWGGETGTRRAMLAQFEFDTPHEDLVTSFILKYQDTNLQYANSSNEGTTQKEGIVTFEMFKGTFGGSSSGVFTWAGKALDPDKQSNTPEFLEFADSSYAAVVQWQSQTGTAEGSLLVSHISDSFPTADANIVLTGRSSGATFTMNPASQRMSNKYGLKRPVTVNRNLVEGLDSLRKEVAARLIGRTDLEILVGKYQTVRYPHVHYVLPSPSRSANTVSWSGAPAAQARGVRKGNVLLEVDATTKATVRWAYISAVGDEDEVTYGTGATDTSDGTAINTGNELRIIIPIRPGDVIRAKNNQTNIDTDQVILKLGYDEGPGVIGARYESIGSNNKFSNIFAAGDAISAAIRAAQPSELPVDLANSQNTFYFTGFVNRGVNPSGANDYRTIHWTNNANDSSGTAGTLTMGDGTEYTIACANSSTLTTAEHTIFFRPTSAKATANTSNTAFQVVLTTDYKADPDDVLIGWCHASSDKRGSKAILVLVPQISSKDLFAAGQNGSLTEALLSKAAQEYSSGLEITPVTSGFDGPPSTRWQQVTWAACTSTEAKLTFGDGDAWEIAGKSGNNYSVTSNGSSYSNITALSASSTYYVFVDTADTAAGGSLTLRFTTNYNHISVASDGTFYSSRVLMGQIAVPANGDDGAAPRVFPFNNRSLTINAASIAASAITATHITASAIDTTHLKLTGTNGIGGLTSNGNINLSNAENTLSLGSTSETSDRKHVTADQRSGGGYAYDGLNGSGRVKLPIGTGDGAKFYSYGQTSGVIVVMDNLGLIGKSGVSGSFPTFTGGTTQFEISSVDGMGKFGGGVITCASDGMHIKNTGAGVRGINFETSAGGNLSTIFPISYTPSGGSAVDLTIWRTASNGEIRIGEWAPGGGGSPSTTPTTKSILLSAQALGFHTEGQVANTAIYYHMPTDIPLAGHVLARKSSGTTSDTLTIEGKSSTVYYLEWVAQSGGGSGDIEGVNITAGTGLTGDVNTTSGTHTQTIDHLTSAGYKHIPAGGSSGQVLTYSSDGTATWQAASAHGTHGGGGTTYTAGDGLDLSGTEFSLDEGFAPTWTAAHNFTNNVNLGNAGTDVITVIGQLRVRDGSATSGDLSIVRSADSTTGFYWVSSGNYRILYFKANDRTIFYGYSDGTNDWFHVDSTMDMNLNSIVDCNEIRVTDGDNNDPSFTFTSDEDTGLYLYATGAPAMSCGGSTKVIWNNGGTTTHFYQAINVHGSLTKTSGTFSIAHPLDEDNKTLVHGFVESPRYDLIYRGSAVLSGGTATVSIDEASNNMTVGTFEALTKNPQVWVQNDTGWGAVKGTVEDGNIIITAEDNTSSDTVSWLVVAERNDTFIRSEEEPWTNEAGDFVPEWDTASLNSPIG